MAPQYDEAPETSLLAFLHTPRPKDPQPQAPKPYSTIPNPYPLDVLSWSGSVDWQLAYKAEDRLLPLDWSCLLQLPARVLQHSQKSGVAA